MPLLFEGKNISKTQFGISVFSLSRQKEVFSHNESKVFSPASTVKILTSMVALRRLGSDFRFVTRLKGAGWDARGVLKGNLYLIGGGDPSLDIAALYQLAREARRRGLRKIHGAIVTDDWLFDQERYDAARIPSESERPYNAPIGALSLNQNTFSVFLYGDGPKKKPKLAAEPESDYLKFSNQLRSSGGKELSLSLKRKEVSATSETFVVSGKLGAKHEGTQLRANVVNPWNFAGAVFQKVLKDVGIEVSERKIFHEKAPDHLPVIASHSSHALSEVLLAMNKTSNNFMADSLVKTLGGEVFGYPGTAEKGLRVITEEATRLGINNAGFRFVSGSGLSRYNRMSPQHFVRLFRSAYSDFDLLPEWLSSFSIAGVDGTLERRMQGNPAFGRFRAKTGTIDGVSALAGLVQTKAGELLTYAVLIQGSARSGWQDDFARLLSEYRSDTSEKVILTESETAKQ